MIPFGQRLARAVRQTGSAAVLGIDPTPAVLPPEYARAAAAGPVGLADAYASFGAGLALAAAGRAAAVKPNIAFFEALGLPGLAAYGEVCRAARAAGLLVIGDVKRGDIGSTAAAYAAGLLDDAPPDAASEDANRLGSHDALTLNPYLGSDSVRPFLDRAAKSGAGVFVLVRTSNPSGAELQELPLAKGGTVADAVARKVAEWAGSGDGWSDVGAVVGATHPGELAHFRQLMPRSWLLLPGYGAQGASAGDAAGAFDADGLGAIVNASRLLMTAWKTENNPADWRGAVRRALDAMNEALNAVRALSAR